MPKTDIILALIRTKDWDGLFQHFRSASNADFRKMEVVVRERVMPQLSNQDFWEAKEAQSVARWLHDNSPESLAKIVRMALPMLVSAQQIEALFQFAGFHDERECVAVLIKESTPYAYYVLFNVLRRAADNRQLLVAACQAIMRKNDDMSFNMASLLRSYFDLNEIKSTFSLQIEPYELSYIEQSYDNFMHVLKGKRPRI